MDMSHLHAGIAAVCPIDGLSTVPVFGADGLPDRIVPPVVTIQFRPEATDEQRAAAEAVLAAYDPAEQERAAAIDAARAYVTRHLPPAVRASMHSYWLANLSSDDPVVIADRAKLAATEAWETEVMELAAKGEPVPEAPGWLAAFAGEF